jgi:ubiquitin carboxyl-terminal hydrolase L3
LVIFLHDCEDARKEPFEFLDTVLRNMTCSSSKHIWIVLNKQDSPNMPVEPRELHHMYDQWMYDNHRSSVRWKVVHHKVSAKTGEGVWEVLDDLHATMAGKGAMSPGNESRLRPRESLEPPENVPSDAEMKTRVQKEIAEDTLDPEHFWSLFLSGDVGRWNHYNYLKAGYVAVLESAKKEEGTFEMVETFLAHMKRLREKSPDKFNNTDQWYASIDLFWRYNSMEQTLFLTHKAGQ